MQLSTCNMPPITADDSDVRSQVSRCGVDDLHGSTVTDNSVDDLHRRLSQLSRSAVDNH